MSKPFDVGAYVCQGLNLAAKGKAYGRDIKASNLGDPTVQDYRGGLRKRGHGGNENPTRYRKSELGNPPPTAGASEFYPNQNPSASDLGLIITVILLALPLHGRVPRPLILCRPTQMVGAPLFTRFSKGGNWTADLERL